MKNKTSMLLFALGFLAFWANGDNYAAAPLLVNIARDLNLAIPTAATSVTAYMMTFGLFTVLFGPLGDRFGRGRIVKVAAFGTATFSILGGLAFNFPSLVVFRGFNGAFAAGIFPVTMALIGESFSDENRQGAIARVMGMMFLGGASATAIGGAIAELGSWREVYILYGVAELALAILVVRVVPSGKPSGKAFSLLSSYRTALSTPGLPAVIGTIFFVGFAVFGSFSYGGHYVEELTGLPLILVGLVVTAFGVGAVVGSRLVPRLRANLGALFLPSVGVVGGASLMSLVFANGPAVMVSGFFGFGLAFVSLQSTLITAAQMKLPHLRGTAMSLASFAMFLGGGIGTHVNGMIIDSVGTPLIYAPAAAFILLTALSSIPLARKPAPASA
ncbi:MAG: MFS transporter [Spirochaetales bacterium]